MNISGETRILKDDKGVYKTTLVTKEINAETNEEESIFMKIHVGFRKGVDVKNKTKIIIKDGFITFFRIATGNTYDNGTPEYKYYPKLIIMDFDIIEDGVDENQPSKKYSNVQNDFDEEGINGYYSGSDELPF